MIMRTKPSWIIKDIVYRRTNRKDRANQIIEIRMTECYSDDDCIYSTISYIDFLWWGNL